ncbi:MAG: hypothetical protein ACREWG_02350 [Gammaproteobacteria bacterium]
MITVVCAALGLGACGGGEGGGVAGGSGASAESMNIAGSWEAVFPEKADDAGTHQGKGKVTFNGSSYSYSWYKKLVGKDGQTVYDWTEQAREDGSTSLAPDVMQWTAESFGEADYNEATRSWGKIDMKSSKNGYNIAYKLDGEKLTLQEDINLDGDYDDVFDSSETMTYTKVN